MNQTQLKEQIVVALREAHEAYDNLEAAKKRHRDLIQQLTRTQIDEFKAEGITNPTEHYVSLQASGEPVNEEE